MSLPARTGPSADAASSQQLRLIGDDVRPQPATHGLGEGVGDFGAPSATIAEPDGRQIDLFAPWVVLGRELESALGRGRFEEALRLRRMLEESYGPSVHTRDLGFLDRLGGGTWQCPPGDVLAVWMRIDEGLNGGEQLRACIRAGVFLRLLEAHTAECLVAAKPECLAALARVLSSDRRIGPEDGRRRARALVRDALLAGRELTSLDFDYDRPVADVLAEDLPPRWLACLGLIRRLWSAPPPDEPERGAFARPKVATGPEDEGASEFWRCLRVAEAADCPEDRLHEARRQMKRLRPELHALYMRRAVVRPQS
jgi:hypothetical protein